MTPSAKTDDSAKRSTALREAAGRLGGELAPAGSLLRAVVRVEVGYALLLVSAFVLPNWIGYRAWIPALALATALAAGHGLLARAWPLLPKVLLAYLAVYAAAALHSDPGTFSIIEAGKYFAPPIFALTVAWAAHRPEIRQRILLLSIAAVALQVPVALFQTADIYTEIGRDLAVSNVDSVTGLLGTSAPGTLAQTGIFAGTLMLSAAYLRVLNPRWAAPAGLVLVFLGAVTSTRASYAFAPLALAALAALLWIATRRYRGKAMITLATALAILVLPVMFVTTGALYPGANKPVSSLDSVLQYLGSEHDPGSTTALPDRGKQLTLALELSVAEGPDITLLGRGMGATRFKSQSLLSRTGATTDPISREEQRTNGVWVPRAITETGFLGVLAFGGLLAYLVVISWRNRPLVRSRSWDGAAILALPGIAALTLVGAFFNTILVIQPYATLFWSLLGVAIAIDAERTAARGNRPPEGSRMN